MTLTSRKKKSESEIINLIRAALRPLQDIERVEVMTLYAGGPQSASVFVRPADIRYIIRHYNKVKVVTDHGEYFLNGGIMDATRVVAPWPFLARTHLRYIVNLDRVSQVVCRGLYIDADFRRTAAVNQDIRKEDQKIFRLVHAPECGALFGSCQDSPSGGHTGVGEGYPQMDKEGIGKGVFYLCRPGECIEAGS